MNLNIDLDIIRKHEGDELTSRDLVDFGLFSHTKEVAERRYLALPMPPSKLQKGETKRRMPVKRYIYKKEDLIKWVEQERRLKRHTEPWEPTISAFKDSLSKRTVKGEEMAEFLFETTSHYIPLVADNSDDRLIRLAIQSHLNEIRNKKDTRE